MSYSPSQHITDPRVSAVTAPPARRRVNTAGPPRTPVTCHVTSRHDNPSARRRASAARHNAG
jgi:hypothetical protein